MKTEMELLELKRHLLESLYTYICPDTQLKKENYKLAHLSKIGKGEFPNYLRKISILPNIILLIYSDKKGESVAFKVYQKKGVEIPDSNFVYMVEEARRLFKEKQINDKIEELDDKNVRFIKG